MAHHASQYTTYIPLPTNSGSCKSRNDDSFLSLVPIHIVTNASQLPKELRNPSPKRPLVIGFDSEGVNLSRHGILCILQIAMPDAIYIVDIIMGGKDLMNACKPALESAYITKVIHDCKRDSEALYYQFGIKLHNVVDTQIAYSVLQEQLGVGQPSDDGISFIGLLADRRFCGISYTEKKEVRSLLKQDPLYWTNRPFREEMVHAAVDDVRFLPYIHHKIMEKLNEQSMWKLAVRGALYCRCFCVSDNGHADWPSIPSVSGDFFQNGKVPEKEMLCVVDVPGGKMGCIIGKKGASIQYVKQSCKAQIIIGGARGPPDKVFVIGPVTEARKGEALLRGLLDHSF